MNNQSNIPQAAETLCKEAIENGGWRVHGSRLSLSEEELFELVREVAGKAALMQAWGSRTVLVESNR